MNTERLGAPVDFVAELGLQQDPFENTLADHFFYADPGLMQRLDLMQHLIQFGDQLLLIAGPAGSGKSTLLSQFRLRAKDSWKICQLDGSQFQSAGHLLHELADFYDTPYGDDNASIGRELIQYAKTLQQDAGLAIVVIDDADQLSDECLTALLSLDNSPQEALRYLRMIFLGDPSLESRLMTLGLNNPRNPIIHRLDMQPFDTQQSAAYLMYRLAIAGYSGDSPFSSTEVEAMHKAADGLPGKLNDFARATLSESIARKLAAKKTAQNKPTTAATSKIRHGLPGGIPLPVIGVGAIVLAGIILWVSGVLTGGDDAQVDLEVQPLQLPDEVQPVIAEEEDTTPIVRSQPEKRIKDVAEPTVTVVPPVAKKVPEQPEPSPPATVTAPETAAPAEPVTETAEVTPAPATDTQATDTTHKEAVTAMQQALDQELATMEQPPATEPEPQPAAPTPAPPPIKTAQLPDWVANAPDEHYTLQLVGLSKEASARDYLKQHDLLNRQAAIITSERKGAPWFSIIYGDFPDKAAAKAAPLPPGLKSVEPWPRTFAAVRESAKP